MRKWIISFFLFIFHGFLYSQSNTITLQGILKDSNGNKVNGKFNMTLNFYDSSTATDPVYSFTPSQQVDVVNGVFSINVDLGTNEIFKTYPELYLGVKVEGEPEFPKMKILSVGYAIHSKYADTLLNPATDLSCSGCVGSEDIENGAITGIKIGDGAVSDAKISSVSWKKITDIPSDIADGDDDTKYQAGNGLSLNGTVFSLKTEYLDGSAYDSRFVNSGEANSISTAMLKDGSVSDAKISSVSWNKLTDVPSGFSDGVDNVGIDGSGKAGYIPKFSGEKTLTNSLISEKNGQIIINSEADASSDNLVVWGRSIFRASHYPAIRAFIHITNFTNYTDPTKASAQSPIMSEAGVIANSGESPKNNYWTGVDFDGVTKTSGFVGARIAAQFTAVESGKANTDLLFLNNSGAGLKANMLIKSDGKVGIGTKTPQAKLEVIGTAENIIRFGNGTVIGELGVYTPSSSVLIGSESNHRLDFQVANGIRATILPNGNFGIGVENPGAPLHIKTSGSSDKPTILLAEGSPEITFQTSSTHYNWRIAVQEDVDGGFEIATGNKDGNALDDTGSAWKNRLVIKGDTGNVGINTLTPTAKLDVNGTAKFNMVGGQAFGNQAGVRFEFGEVYFPDFKNTSCKTVKFNKSFSAIPYVVATINHRHNSSWGSVHDSVTVWLEKISNTQFEACVRETDADDNHDHLYVHWIAIGK